MGVRPVCATGRFRIPNAVVAEENQKWLEEGNQWYAAEQISPGLEDAVKRMAQIRLDKFLANAGCGTRSEVKKILKKGLVTVNGEAAAKPEAKIDDQTDQVFCQGKEISVPGFSYYMLNKPAGYLSATKDERLPVVLDLLHEPNKESLFPAGRLDIDTVGLLLLTNDGALAHALLSPQSHVDKTYLARLDDPVTEEDCRKFREGFSIGERRDTLPADLKNLSPEELQAMTGEVPDEKKDLSGQPGLDPSFPAAQSWVSVTIREGKFHQVKRMFEAVGRQVLFLKRISFGSLKLDETLSPGEYRGLTKEEIEGLKNDVARKTGGHL